jgi:lysozyme family protein
VSFARAFDLLIKQEGGWSNHPSDPGGLTKWGITQRDYPNLDLVALTIGQAQAIYKHDYWDAIRGDALPPMLAELVFDAAVNQGVFRATKLMQVTLQVSADGIIGPKTISAAQNADPYEFAALFGAERALHYASLSTFDVFGRGWMRRLLRTTIKVTHGVQDQ